MSVCSLFQTVKCINAFCAKYTLPVSQAGVGRKRKLGEKSCLGTWECSATPPHCKMQPRLLLLPGFALLLPSLPQKPAQEQLQGHS